MLIYSYNTWLLVQCQVCGPDVEHDIVMQCPYCKGFFCEKHIEPMNHRCVVLYGTMGPVFNMNEVISQLTSVGTSFPTKRTPQEEKDYYESVLTQSPGIVSIGKEPLDLFTGTLLIFLALSGIYNIYLAFTGNFKALYSVLIDFLIIAPGFILHELSHKYMALKKKFYARYVLHEKGILLTLLTALIGIGFIVPGFVAILGRPNKEENGEISIVGPLTNIGFALAGFIIVAIYQFALGFTTGFFLYVIYRVIFINGFIALFNLLPVWNLDGAKILKWNWVYWLVSTAVSTGLFVFSIIYSP